MEDMADSDSDESERAVFVQEVCQSVVDVSYTIPKRYNKEVNGKKRLLTTSIVGIFFNMIIGTLLHFTFEWFGCFKPFGAVMPVNESVWEHTKMHFLPVILYSFIEFIFVRKHTNYFMLSKFVNITSAIVINVSIFYFYTIWIDHNVAIDVIIFYCSITIGQANGYFIFMVRGKPMPGISVISALLVMVFGSLLILFTYMPPYLPIFIDSNTEQTGIHCNAH
eukprot:327688_1